MMVLNFGTCVFPFKYICLFWDFYIFLCSISHGGSFGNGVWWRNEFEAPNLGHAFGESIIFQRTKHYQESKDQQGVVETLKKITPCFYPFLTAPKGTPFLVRYCTKASTVSSRYLGSSCNEKETSQTGDSGLTMEAHTPRVFLSFWWEQHDSWWCFDDVLCVVTWKSLVHISDIQTVLRIFGSHGSSLTSIPLNKKTTYYYGQ